MQGIDAVLFVDAYDSFSRNIIALLYDCIPAAEVIEIHIDTDITATFGVDLDIFVKKFDAVVLGPGPGNPHNKEDIGLFQPILSIASEYQIPVLGICLGFQVLCLRYGLEIERLDRPCHGQTKQLFFVNEDIFQNVPERHHSYLAAMNYNSLGARIPGVSRCYDDSLSQRRVSVANADLCDLPLGTQRQMSQKGLRLLAWDEEGYVMSVKATAQPFWGMQFHPESCASISCRDLLKNWWLEARTFRPNNTKSLRQTFRTAQDSLWFTERTQSFSISAMPISSHDHNQPKPNVSWQITKLKSLEPSALSSLCFTESRGFPTAMLESTAKGRYSIYAFPELTSQVMTYYSGKLLIQQGTETVSIEAMQPRTALEVITKMTKARAGVGGCPAIPFWGGFMGYMSYEMGLDLINVQAETVRTIPDFNFVFVERSIVLDTKTQDVCIQSIKENDDAWITTTKSKLQFGKGGKYQMSLPRTSKLVSPQLYECLMDSEAKRPDHDTYISKIETCQAQLHAGNSYELCLTAEAQVDIPHPSDKTSFELYQNLNRHNPVPYASYLHFPASPAANIRQSSKHATTIHDLTTPALDTLTILSTSPEMFLSASRTGVLDMMPMKGTVQRTPTTTWEDAFNILSTPKETAENLMIADLIRHDLYGAVGCKRYAYFGDCCDPNRVPGYHYNTYWPKRGRGIPSEDDAGNPDDNNDTTPKMTTDPLCVLALNSVKEYSTVYQMVSHIRAYPPPHLLPHTYASTSSPSKPFIFPSSPYSILTPSPQPIIQHNHSAIAHVLPPGSMTGAPKKRSCEILCRLEDRNRGVYSGVIGYWDVGGGGCWSVAIRTAFSTGADEYVMERGEGISDDGGQQSKRGSEDEHPKTGSDDEYVNLERRKVWHVGAGGAITVLSDAEAEWQEMTGKMNNVLKGFRT